ncbi:hypothetical protein KAJ27_01905 [bacterium]|nr:hypothetical protein [bacterium]
MIDLRGRIGWPFRIVSLFPDKNYYCYVCFLVPFDADGYKPSLHYRNKAFKAPSDGNLFFGHDDPVSGCHLLL